ncbi:hypothetical protein TeGR_g8909, partial [Tetraparma gracilis]
YDTWPATLSAFPGPSPLGSELKFLFTAYTLEECADDFDAIEAAVTSRAVCLWEPERNPFGSRKVRETKGESGGREYRENAAWQCWSLPL